MKNMRASLILSISLLTLTVAIARAADRVQPGQWETTISAGGQDRVIKSCVSAAEANTANGNEKNFRESVVKSAEQAGCKVKDAKVSGIK